MAIGDLVSIQLWLYFFCCLDLFIFIPCLVYSILYFCSCYVKQFVRSYFK